MRIKRQLAIIVFVVLLSPSALAAGAHQPPAASQQLLTEIDFDKATPIDEAYRAEFKACDEADRFRGHQMVGWRKCTGDKNNVTALLKLADGSIYYESKLGLDLDGSWKAWHSGGAADQRDTWYTWPPSCKRSERDSHGLCEAEQVDAEHIPFSVIPIAGPTKSLSDEFMQKTGINKGDLGVVIYGAKWAPVLVADGGPYNKLGEGSAALLAALGEDRCLHHNASGFCDRYLEKSIPSSVITIVFPGSSKPGMTRDNAISWMCDAVRAKLNLTGSPLCPH